MSKTSVTDDMISRYLSGNSNDEEQRTLLAWINENPENEKQLFVLKDIYDAAAAKQLFEKANTQERWEQIQSRLVNRQTQPSTDRQSLQSTDQQTLQSTDRQTQQSTDQQPLQSTDRQSLQSTDQQPLQSTDRKPLQLEDRQLLQSSKPATKSSKIAHWALYAVRYAAVLLIGILGAVAAFHFFATETKPQKSAVLTYQVTTEKGERATVTLPDGSIVKLNACSSLSCQSNYGENDRDVVFSGEAFFDIRTNPDIPFAVKTYGLNINAYGTAFNVKAYPEDDMIETTLVNGMVSIKNQHDQQIITLEPNQVIAIPKSLVASSQKNTQTTATPDDQVPVKIEKADLPKTKNPIRQEAVLRKNVKTEEYTSWKDDRWIIKSESLESLAKKIERRYDVSIHIVDEASKKYVFSGTLRNYPLEQVLDIIRLNAPIQYSIKEKTVVIKEETQLKKQYQKLINSQ